MNVIKKPTLDEYARKHADASEQLRAWRKLFEKHDFRDLHAIRKVLPETDFAAPYTIFNIKGNHYRLITIIHYRYKRVYIRDFFTHAEYDRWNGKRK